MREAGYHALWKGQRSWNGVAILTRDAPAVEIRRELPGDPPTTRAATSKRRSTASSSPASTCPTATRSPVPSSTTSWPGSSAARSTRRRCGTASIRWSWRRLERGADRLRHLQPALLEEGRAAAAREPRLLGTAAGAGLDRRHPQAAPRDGGLHVLGLLPPALGEELGLRIDHLLLSDELAPCLREAGVDTWVRGQPHASDHAPTWVRLDLGRLKGRAR
jgi:exodeoxyribonuclease-3